VIPNVFLCSVAAMPDGGGWLQMLARGHTPNRTHLLAAQNSAGEKAGDTAKNDFSLSEPPLANRRTCHRIVFSPAA